MINKNCPLCGSNQYTIVDRYRDIGSEEYNCRMVRCNSCGHYFSEITQDIDLEQMYSQGKYKVVDIRGSMFDKIISIGNKMIIKQLSKFKVSKKTILDFGCGKGHFIQQLSMRGWEVKGIETARERAEFGINVYGLDINTHNYQTGLIHGGPFNIITLFHVVEHLSKPKELLRELIENNLTQNGYLVIEVPLFESFQSKISGEKWIHLDPPFHISHFTKITLLKLLDELGLKPVRHEYFSIHSGMLGMVQSLMSLFGYRKMIISELKFRRTKRLMVAVCAVLPVALLLECAAVLLKRGGVFRVYCKFKS